MPVLSGHESNVSSFSDLSKRSLDTLKSGPLSFGFTYSPKKFQSTDTALCWGIYFSTRNENKREIKIEVLIHGMMNDKEMCLICIDLLVN
jgi:hypothetical protein